MKVGISLVVFMVVALGVVRPRFFSVTQIVVVVVWPNLFLRLRFTHGKVSQAVVIRDSDGPSPSSRHESSPVWSLCHTVNPERTIFSIQKSFTMRQ